MKILWVGAVYNATGISTASRALCLELEKLGCQIQTTDIYESKPLDYPHCKHWNQPIDTAVGDVHTVYFTYPHWWNIWRGKVSGGFVFEGTRLWPHWIDKMNHAPQLWCPSEATANLFRLNGVTPPIEVIPHGIDPDFHRPVSRPPDGDFTFLSIASWLGKRGERKGVDLLVEAFDEEFGREEPVRLLFKGSTFWARIERGFYQEAIETLLGHANPRIMVNENLLTDPQVRDLYHQADCFVAPTRGEGFGLPLLEALACGLPLITTRDFNSGHIDFCEGNPGVLFIPSAGQFPADETAYPQGSLLSEPDKQALRQQMRYAFEHRDEVRERGRAGAALVHRDWTWELAGRKMFDWLRSR